MSNDRSALYQFLGGCLHQDWMFDSEDPDAIVRAHLSEALSEDVARAAVELGEVLRAHEGSSDADIEHVLYREYGCDYPRAAPEYPPGRGWRTCSHSFGAV